MNLRKSNFKNFFILALTVMTFAACNNTDDSDPESEPIVAAGILTLQFDNVVGDKDLVLNSETYTNESKEDYTISELKYIISNIVLVDKDGKEVVYPREESYFLLDEKEPGTLSLNLENIPIGAYKTLKFGFGVDQNKYPLAGANFVPEAEEKDMIWSWTTGFKFIKFEGKFTTLDTDPKDFIIHVGSHGTNIDNYKEISLTIDGIVVSETTPTNIAITADIAKVFDATNVTSLLATPEVQLSPEVSPKIATNITSMFTIK